LVYDCTCVYGRSNEWSTTSGPGYPVNVQVNGGTSVNIGNGAPSTARQIAGSLDAKSGGVFLMDFPGSQMTAALTVLKNILVESGGSLNLSTLGGGDLKVQGDFTNNGTFTPNNRAVFFEGTASQNLTDASGTATMPYVRVNKGGGTVLLQSNLTTLGPSGGDSLQFLGTTSTLTFNGKTLTLGSTVGTPPAGSGFVGDASASLSLQDGGTGPGGAMGTLTFVNGGQSLNSLTINRTGANASATLGSDLTLGGALNLTAGDINTGSFTLTHNGTPTGTTDVVGNLRRTDLGSTARSFGNPNNQLSFQTGTAPTEMTVNLVKNVPTGAGFGFPGAVKRTYTITPTGGGGYTATLRLHYNDSDLNGNTEALLDFWRFNGSSWNRVTKALADPVTGNWIQTSAVTQFSPWTIAQGGLLSKAKLVEFKATQYDATTTLEWKTGYEVDNLGFNVYREVAGSRALVNTSLIAGSALVAGPGVALTAGNSYAWTDVSAGASARYWLEEIDLAGKSTLHGPYVATRAVGRGGRGARSPLIAQLGGTVESVHDAQRQWTATDDASLASVTPAEGGEELQGALDKQRWLASQPAVKISVRETGWHAVTREQLIAAGLNSSADPRRLQMYLGGVEIPIHLDAEGWREQGAALEFYGEGLDVTSTDTRVYWLVEGDSAGLRTDSGGGAQPPPIDPGGRPGGRGLPGGPETGRNVIGIEPPTVENLEYFDYTIERRDRTVYFSSLQNGDAENFFGQVVNATQTSQTLTARNVYQFDASAPKLEVSLQGVTGGTHHVAVRFNGSEVGALDFVGQQLKSASFDIASGALHEGDNQVQLVSSGSSDVTITEHLRLTYPHKLMADDDRLRFHAPAGNVSVGGFTTPNIRVVDVTNPASPVEVRPDGEPTQDIDGAWGLTFSVGDSAELLAFAEGRFMSPSSVAANKPSSLAVDAAERADLLVITHGDFTQQVAPLVAERTAEGMVVKVIDVEDLYDEFSYGTHSPQAVRDFLSLKHASQNQTPTYVLFVGDGTYDPRDHLGRGRYDLVPSKLVDAGAMETASDDWFADFDDDGIADFSIGRLPVRTQAEAATVVNKIVSRTFDSSQTSALMVADRDGSDGYNFETATDAVQNLLPSGSSVTRINRRSQDAGVVRSQIVAGVNAGPLVVNWMGHGSIDVWTGDGLLRGSDAASLTNGNRLPLFVMMTCLNGYYEGTGLDSLAESVLKAEHGGAYAVWASSGMTDPTAQADADRELYRILFSGGSAVRLGDAVRSAKAATADRDVRRTWVFFGDPSSTLR
ncbi:MAG: C25 family cysteine peptidase, partial [Pyrinomonadaceae bacterium]